MATGRSASEMPDGAVGIATAAGASTVTTDAVRGGEGASGDRRMAMASAMTSGTTASASHGLREEGFFAGGAAVMARRESSAGVTGRGGDGGGSSAGAGRGGSGGGAETSSELSADFGSSGCEASFKRASRSMSPLFSLLIQEVEGERPSF